MESSTTLMEIIDGELPMWKKEKELSILETPRMNGPHDLAKNPP